VTLTFDFGKKGKVVEGKKSSSEVFDSTAIRKLPFHFQYVPDYPQIRDILVKNLLSRALKDHKLLDLK